MNNFIVCMPIYNENYGLLNFLEEFNQIEDLQEIIIINDASTDNSIQLLSSVQFSFKITLLSNKINLGHGPSTLKALSLASSSEFEIIVAVDGDGQFKVSDILKLVNILRSEDYDVVEGVRKFRNEPFFRKFSTFATKMLVFIRSLSWPSDANTPLRIYKKQALLKILNLIPKNLMTPNIYISSVTRKYKLKFVEVPVRSLPRRNTDSTGTMWGTAKVNFLPTKRFLVFCIRASKQWFQIKI